MSSSPPPSRPVSPWLLGGIVLAVFVGLAIVLHGAGPAARIMLAVGLLVAALTVYRRRPAATTAPPPPASVRDPFPAPPDPFPAVPDRLPLPAVLTIDEAAAYLRTDVATLAGELEAGRLPGNLLAGSWRIPRRTLDDWLNGSFVAGGERSPVGNAG